MHIFYDKTKVNYITLGEGKDYIVFLHGWGGSIESFLFVAKSLKLNKRYLIIDFPPFGESDIPNSVWGVEDYAECLKKVIENEKIEKFDIISHSFGGRVAIYFASVYTNYVNKLVLVGSAGLKPKRGIKYHFKVNTYKLLKKFGFHLSQAGSEDYKKLSPHMKKVFVKIVNRNLKKECKQIISPTLLIYGENDNETPVYMAKKFNRLIKNSKLIVLKNAGHFAFLDKFHEFKAIIESYLEDK